MNYEIHLTVSLSEGYDNLARFKETCEMLEAKAIVIDAYPLRDVMTSYRMKAETNKEVFHTMTHQVLVLEGRGFHVLRSKVETDLGNPQSWDPLPNQYFESHIQLSLTANELQELKSLQEELDFHISSNAFKPVIDCRHVRMVTIRQYHTTPEDFTKRIEAFRRVLQREGFTLVKDMELEFALYDSNQQHDRPWLEAR